jgi:5-methylcytosine-specific restriction endonuclease McrA
MMERCNEKCERCGWGEHHPTDNKVPLELDHIDGAHTNNVESNLRMLCPNCHSLTPTYKSRNSGNSTREYKPE